MLLHNLNKLRGLQIDFFLIISILMETSRWLELITKVHSIINPTKKLSNAPTILIYKQTH